MRQPDLNFAVSAPELFAGPEMGEDALRVLGGIPQVLEGGGLERHRFPGEPTEDTVPRGG